MSVPNRFRLVAALFFGLAATAFFYMIRISGWEREADGTRFLVPDSGGRQFVEGRPANNVLLTGARLTARTADWPVPSRSAARTSLAARFSARSALAPASSSPRPTQAEHGVGAVPRGAVGPDGLAGAAIPDLVRLVTICDIHSALTERRPYRDPLPHGAAQ